MFGLCKAEYDEPVSCENRGEFCEKMLNVVNDEQVKAGCADWVDRSENICKGLIKKTNRIRKRAQAKREKAKEAKESDGEVTIQKKSMHLTLHGLPDNAGSSYGFGGVAKCHGC